MLGTPVTGMDELIVAVKDAMFTILWAALGQILPLYLFIFYDTIMMNTV